MFTAEKFGLVKQSRHAGDDQVVVLLGVVVAVDAALDEARAAHDAEHLVLLDELAGQRRDLRRIDLLLLGDVLDRAAVDAAVVVDALEVGGRHPGDPGEVGDREFVAMAPILIGSPVASSPVPALHSPDSGCCCRCRCRRDRLLRRIGVVGRSVRRVVVVVSARREQQAADCDDGQQ